MQPKDKQSESFDTFAGGDQKPSSPAFKEESIDYIYKKFQEDQERIIEDELNKNQLFSNILIQNSDQKRRRHGSADSDEGVAAAKQLRGQEEDSDNGADSDDLDSEPTNQKHGGDARDQDQENIDVFDQWVNQWNAEKNI